MGLVRGLGRALTISAPIALFVPAALAQQAPAAAPAQGTPSAQVPIPAQAEPAKTEKMPPAEVQAPAAAKAPAEAKAPAKAPAEAKAPAKAPVEAKAPAKAPSKAGAKQQAKAPPQERLPAMLPGTVGRGPLTLTSSAAVTYQEYFADGCPQVLAVSAFGWATHAEFGAPKDCPGGKPTVVQATVKSALNACNAAAYDPPCQVLAVGSKIVWEGPIGVLRGRYIPVGDNQFSAVLRKVMRDGEPSAGFETAVGIATYAADGQSADFRFMTHDELGECRGSLRRHDGDTRTVALTCTVAGAISGGFDPGADGRTGTGAATGEGERAFVLKVLPHTDFMDKGSTGAQPPLSENRRTTQPGTRGKS